MPRRFFLKSEKCTKPTVCSFRRSSSSTFREVKRGFGVELREGELEEGVSAIFWIWALEYRKVQLVSKKVDRQEHFLAPEPFRGMALRRHLQCFLTAIPTSIESQLSAGILC